MFLIRRICASLFWVTLSALTLCTAQWLSQVTQGWLEKNSSETLKNYFVNFTDIPTQISKIFKFELIFSLNGIILLVLFVIVLFALGGSEIRQNLNLRGRIYKKTIGGTVKLVKFICIILPALYLLGSNLRRDSL